MSAGEAAIAVVIIVGFFSVLFAVIVLVALIANDLLDRFRGRHRVDPARIAELERALELTTTVEFFRPRYARNRRA